MDDAQFPATAGSERPGAAWRPGLPKSPRAPHSPRSAPVTGAPVTGSASGGVLAGGAPDVADPASKRLPDHGGDGDGSG